LVILLIIVKINSFSKLWIYFRPITYIIILLSCKPTKNLNKKENHKRKTAGIGKDGEKDWQMALLWLNGSHDKM
jgi:hypothetical protein